MQNLDTIVTAEDIFKMFDNMSLSLCVTQKNKNEVKELNKIKVKELAGINYELITCSNRRKILYTLDLKLEEKFKEIRENHEKNWDFEYQADDVQVARKWYAFAFGNWQSAKK